MELAKKHGPYSSFYLNGGCPLSKGLLQYHLWGLDNSNLTTHWNWKELIDNIKTYGVRNSLLTSIMPTATTSQIMGNSEYCEPITTNLYTRTTLAGEFVIVNKYLVEKLISLDLWNKDIRDELYYDNGSIQKINEIPANIKAVYKTAFEMKTKPLVQLAIDRGPFIDQSQSLNIFCKVPDFDMLTSSHFYTWRNKLKTGMYYLRTQPAVDPIKFGLDQELINKIEHKRGTGKVIYTSTSSSKHIVCDSCSS
jgi:ribonucleotide reductase alpha subunit